MRTGKIKIPFILLTSIFLLYGCGDKIPKEELAKKEKFVIMNNFMDDKKTKEEQELERQRKLDSMSEEELAELEVDEELDLNSSKDGTIPMYGFSDDWKPYLKKSIEDGMAIPKEGKVVFLDDGMEESSDASDENKDDLSIALMNQKDKLDYEKLAELREQKRLNEDADRLIEEKKAEEERERLEKEQEKKDKNND